MFVIAPPRSGGGLVAAALSQAGELPAGPLSTGQHIDDTPGLSAQDRHFTSHRLTATDAQPWRYSPGTDVLEWNPRLGLRLGFLAATIPTARFIVVTRRPVPAISSLMRAWRSGRFTTVADLPDWWGEPWSFGLTDGWRDLIGAPLAEVAAHQWGRYQEAILTDVERLDPSRWMATSYERLVSDPAVEIMRMAQFADVAVVNADKFSSPQALPLSTGTVTRPNPSKWVSEASEIYAALPAIQATITAWQEFRDIHTPEPTHWDGGEEPVVQPDRLRSTLASAGTPFSSSHTSTVPELLGLTSSSLVVTTYKSGHLIFMRRDADGKLNTEFASYPRPMGAAAAGSRLSLGTGTSIMNYSNTPALASALDPPDVNDAVFTLRSMVNTGDIAMHEMVYAGEQLWFVNTRFSCLCTMDLNYSFVPRWRPPWISALAGEDRCHLNGVALRDGRPRYITALSQTDTPFGWRELKGVAGLVMDIATNTVIVDNLAMPHSPRWHDGALWVLESGMGTLVRIDVDTGVKTSIAQLPGFTRGLTFLGPYAVIGLSQVRESVFKDLPVTQSAAERNCGVWLVDTRTGDIAGYVKFDGVVQEIFDVQALNGTVWPTILTDAEMTASSFVLSEETLAQVAAPRIP